MSRACVVCWQYVPGSHDVDQESVAVHERCHHGRQTEARFGVARPDDRAVADGGDPR